MRKFHLLFVIPALLALPVAASAGELKLSIQNGLVTLVADEVPLSAIMAEWARVGRTQIVNGDKVSTPVSLQIVDMPERRALDVVLRAVSGYMVAERTTPVAGASVFDRIMILPTSRPPANTGPIGGPPPSFVPRPVAPPVQAMPDSDDDEPVMPAGMAQPNMPGATPQPMPGPNPQTMPGQQTPNAPLTAPRPGQLPAPPPQQPVPFGTPPKPGGGGGGAF
jgi:hypothetical protein